MANTLRITPFLQGSGFWGIKTLHFTDVDGRVSNFSSFYSVQDYFVFFVENGGKCNFQLSDSIIKQTC